MKTASRLAHRATVFGAVLLVSTLVHAQLAPAPRPAAPAAVETGSETILLTPFEVTTSRDVGYQATETLAGSRIRTDLRDVGSAISVATQEFMRDIGATDNQTLLQYMTSTEVGGTFGNFSGLGDSSVPNTQDSLLRPNTNTRVRGLAAADNTRDFFLTDIPWDGYNISRVEVLRGANSILFGNGSAAGIINNGTDQAAFGRNSGTVDVRYGSYGSYRGSLNFNHQLVPNQLALRVATLHDNRYYQQEPAFNRDRRYYGALRAEPAFLKKGDARTQLRVTYEAGDINANRPRTNTPADGVYPWFLTANREMRSPDGTLLGVIRPMKSHAGYDPFVTGINDAGLITANPSRRDIGARASLGAANGNTSEAWLGRGTFPGIAGWQNGGFGAIFPDPNSGQMSYYMPQAPGPLYNAIASTGIRDGSIQGLRGVDNAAIVRLDQYAILGVGGRLTENDGFLYERQGVYKNLGIQDASIYNFYDRLIDGPNKKEAAKFNAFNVQLEQTFFREKAGFQLAYDRQSYSEYQLNYMNNDSFITIDVYRYLPIAQLNATTGLLEPVLNPNFGRPFVAITPGGRRAWRERENARFTPFADLDFKNIIKTDNIITKVLGRHTLTGLLEANKFKNRGLGFSRFAVDQSNAAALSGPNQGVNARRLAVVSYLGPSLATASTASGVNISNLRAIQQVVSGPANYFDATYRTGAPAAGTALTMNPGLAPNQTGTSTANTALFQSENPANYNGWSTTLRTLNVVNAESGAETILTTNDNERRDETKSWAIVDQWKLLNGHIVFTGGLRRDKIETFRPGNLATTTAVTALNGNRATVTGIGNVDYTAPFAYADTPTNSYTSEVLKTWSVVAHSPNFINRHLPFGLRLSAFFNRSENFRPESRVGVYGDPISPPVGTTKDYGFAVSALDGKVSLRVNRYRTLVKNASEQDNSVLNFMADEVDRGIQFAKAVQNRAGSQGTSGGGLYAFPMVVGGVTLTDASGATRYSAYQPATGTATTWTEADWVAADTQAQAQAKAFLDATLAETRFLNAWNIRPDNWTATASNFNMGHSTPGGATVTGDTVSTGTEFELFVRPMDNWNISMNAAKTSAKRVALAGSLSEFIEKRWELYKGPAGDVRWFGGGNGGGSTLPGARPGDPIADYGRVRFGRNGWRWYQEYRAKEGADVPELRPWRFNATTSYRFNGKGLGGERLKGAFIGGSFRWEDRNIIGFQVKEVTPALGSVNPAIGAYDVTKPFHGAYEKHFDFFGGYTRRIFKNIDWRLQANVRNAFEKDRLIAINTNPDGSAAGVRIAYGPTWELSSRFEF